jgi:hypothetical protein
MPHLADALSTDTWLVGFDGQYYDGNALKREEMAEADLDEQGVRRESILKPSAQGLSEAETEEKGDGDDGDGAFGSYQRAVNEGANPNAFTPIRYHPGTLKEGDRIKIFVSEEFSLKADRAIYWSSEN